MERGGEGNAFSVICKREKSSHLTLQGGKLITNYPVGLNLL